MIETNKGLALFANCEGFLTELSADDEAVLSGGRGGRGRRRRTSGRRTRRSLRPTPRRRRRRRSKTSARGRGRRGGFRYRH